VEKQGLGGPAAEHVEAKEHFDGAEGVVFGLFQLGK